MLQGTYTGQSYCTVT